MTGPAPAEGRARRGTAVVLSVLACLLVLGALLAPNEYSQVTRWAWLRIPVEMLLIVALLAVLPWRARRVAAVLMGVALGLLTVMSMLDIGFAAVVSRPFDPVLDWTLFNDAVGFVKESSGGVAAVGAVVAAVLLVVAVLVVMALAMVRLSRLVARHRGEAIGAVLVLAMVWSGCAALGAQFVPGVPVAARNAAGHLKAHAFQARASLLDQQEFTTQAAVDRFRDTPRGDLLSALHGKDVVVTFVESYGRVALDDPEFAPRVGALLDAGTQRLNAAGFEARSGFLDSPVVGSGSWMAHATFLSGLHIDNQRRYRSLVASDRLTLSGAFRDARWRTAAIMPGTTRAWPEGIFYGYDQVEDSRTLGYRGPHFGWSAMPDQYTLLAFERAVHAKRSRVPFMAEIDLTSSHWPWTPIPRLTGWDQVGDGSRYLAEAAEGEPAEVVWQDPARVRDAYRRSLEYSLESLISYVQTYGDDNLVLIFLGDHQPSPIIAGPNAGRDVPITIVTRDRAVLDRIAGWHWQPGLRPDPQAPVWPMEAFRDRFFSAFGRQH